MGETKKPGSGNETAGGEKSLSRSENGTGRNQQRNQLPAFSYRYGCAGFDSGQIAADILPRFTYSNAFHSLRIVRKAKLMKALTLCYHVRHDNYERRGSGWSP